MKNAQSGYINLDFTGIFIGIAIVAAAAGAVLAYVIPWLWSLVKPWIHALTA